MVPELGLIFDAGTGIFRARDLIQTETLDIVLSHVHLDHSIGLTFLYDVLHEREVSQVNVHVAEDKVDAIKNHLFQQQLFPVMPPFEIRPFQDGQIQLDSGTELNAIPLKHPVAATVSASILLGTRWRTLLILQRTLSQATSQKYRASIP